jgi:hypothetical protein
MRGHEGTMKCSTGWQWRKAWMLLSALLLSNQVMSAGASDSELDEVLINGVRVKPTRDPQKIVNWLKLLVGEFSYGGYVQLRGEGVSTALLSVEGRTSCIAFGRAPGVHCELKVAWPEARGAEGQEVPEVPGGISTLTPAMVEYGLDTDRLGIRYMLVDNRGMANYGDAYLVGNTLATVTPCPDIPDCTRTTRITPRVDGELVEMEVEIEKELTRRARFRFVLQRQGDVPEGAISGGEQASWPAMPRTAISNSPPKPAGRWMISWATRSLTE